MKRRWAVAAAGVSGALLGLGALASCGSRTGLPVDETAEAGEEFGVIVPDHFVEEPREEHARDVRGEEIPGIDTNRPDVPPFNPCPDAAATLIYLIGNSGNLYSFDPNPPGSFSLIGAINCPVDSADRPFSMAVDHTGIAYVLFSDSSITNGVGIFRVSTKTGTCSATKYDAKAYGTPTFGMGFVANVSDAGVEAGPDGGVVDTLYVSKDVATDGELGRIDTTTGVLTWIGNYNPSVAYSELTGTGGGDLYAFQPLIPGMTSDSFIAQIDPTTAKVIALDSLPGLQAGNGWAFAFWGGNFYTFTAPAGVTVVNKFDPKTKSINQVASFPFMDFVVGAGVSTCAPQG